MTVPDQNHINHVCDALWRPGGGASVMVGSGFSQHARSVRHASRPLPMLDDIAAELVDLLYPDSDTGERPPPERVPRLAQEYRDTFGRPALHDTLRRLVPDDDYAPASAHKRLLQLPWSDVFTTNWDTLLERATRRVPERSYTVMRSEADIPWSTRPRIVKLHGSLPNPRLILTEEDYRTYPVRFAPFVNTVQQAMMETVFMLIGFSGDDTNFLHWSGWVRDNLRDAAPNIYLAGYLDLSQSKRTMLQRRKVIPIDLARHPMARNWLERGQEHDYAIRWILSTLEGRQPYDISKWPVPRVDPSGPDDDRMLLPITKDVSAEPREEPSEPQSQMPPEEELRVVRDTLGIWKHNRKHYPGWLVMPYRVRQTRSHLTEIWTPIVLRALPEMGIVERLGAVGEMVWRYATELTQMPDEVAMSARELLDSIDCTRRTIEGMDSEAADWAEVRVWWRRIGLELLTAARYCVDERAFTMWLERLEPFVRDDVDTGHRLHHERCLWALWSLDYGSLDKHLNEWEMDDGDPAWKVRKSALLREAGQADDGVSLVEKALEEIRSAPGTGESLAGLSREGWALWSLHTFPRNERVHDRWTALAARNCDPSGEIQHMVAALAIDRDKEEARHFDLGRRRRKTIHFFAWVWETASFRSIRLTEVGGLPLAVDMRGIAGHLLLRAAERLVVRRPGLAMRQVLRVATFDEDKTLMRVVSRERVAALTEKTARDLAESLRRMVAYSVRRLVGAGEKRSMSWVERARVAMEGLSRLVLRLDGEAALEVFVDVLRHYRDPKVASEFWLHKPLRHLLERSWRTLSVDQRMEHARDVLGSPVVGSSGFEAEELGGEYPDPGDILDTGDAAPKRMESDGQWEHMVRKLVRDLGIEGTARERAASRISKMASWKLLTPDEEKSVARGLWAKRCGGDGELPGGTYIFDFAFILLPEPKVGLGREGFGQKWMSGDMAEVHNTSLFGSGAVGLPMMHTDPKRTDDILWQVGSAVGFLRRHGRSLSLSREETVYVTEIIGRWVETSVNVAPQMRQLLFDAFKPSLRGACHGLSWILAEIEITTDLAGRLYEMVRRMNEVKIPAYDLLPGIANAKPDLLDEVALLMSIGMTTDDGEAADNAMWSLGKWMMWAAHEARGFIGPPSHLVREIGRAVAARRRTVLGSALECARWVFEKGDGNQREAIREAVLEGLGYLVEVVRYDRERLTEEVADVPLTRWRCVRVARTLAREGLDESPVVRRWLEVGKEDPLPEVRHVAHSWYGVAGVGGAAGEGMAVSPEADGDGGLAQQRGRGKRPEESGDA